jgi:hypothetical protein
MPNAIAVIAMAEGGTLLHAPDVYMDKIAIGPGYPKGWSISTLPEENIRALAKAKGVPREITACILDRPRHAELIAAVRKTGAAIRLITDGDVAGVIHTAEPDEDRHRHLSRHRRRAGRRAGGGGAALHRRPDAGPAAYRIAGLGARLSCRSRKRRAKHAQGRAVAQQGKGGVRDASQRPSGR